MKIQGSRPLPILDADGYRYCFNGYSFQSGFTSESPKRKKCLLDFCTGPFDAKLWASPLWLTVEPVTVIRVCQTRHSMFEVMFLDERLKV